MYACHAIATEAPTRTHGIGMRLVMAAASDLGGTTKTDITHDGSQQVLEFTTQNDI
tara:strand:- start:3262 stop:3429 length:168 start_codon:yes stop_codon:yes gene_type:complete